MNYNNFPFKPKKWPFFYGWNILFWGIVGILLSAPGQTTGVSAYTEHLIDALGITRLELSSAYMIGTICSAIILTPAGKLYDRIGSRWVAGAACFMLGLVLFCMSHADKIGYTLAKIMPTTVAMLTTMSVLFFLLRFSGQGLLTLSSRNMVMKWFDHHRGLASGISGVATGYGFANAPQLFHKWIGHSGWSGSWQHMSLIWIAVCTPLILIFFRDNPEGCGLIPDGSKNAAQANKKNETFLSMTLSEARHTSFFWVFSFSLALQSLYITAVTFHIESIFSEMELDGAKGFDIFPASAVISIFVTLIGGWLSDHIALRWFFKLFLLNIIFSATGLIFLSHATIPLIIVSMGITGGLFGLLLGITWPKCFGRKHLGAISGFSMSMMVFGSAIGPMMFSLSLRLGGNYKTALLICLVVAIILFIAAIFKGYIPTEKKQHA